MGDICVPQSQHYKSHPHSAQRTKTNKGLLPEINTSSQPQSPELPSLLEIAFAEDKESLSETVSPHVLLVPHSE